MEPTVLVALIGLAGITVTALIGPITLRIYDKRRQDTENKRETKKEAEEHKRREEENKAREAWLEEVRGFVKPIGEDVTEIKHQQKLNNNATVVDLRVQMQRLKDDFVARGYADDFDKLTFDELYKSYTDLGGNHLAERVDSWKEIVKDLPTERPAAKRKSTKKKSTTD